jgi:hypothetical protein
VSFACALVWSGVALLVSACAGQERSSAYQVLFRVESDPGQTVAGDSVSFRGRVLATTDDDGAVLVLIHGKEGGHVALSVFCPEGFLSPGRSTDVVLHRLADPGRTGAEYDVRCPPVLRGVVVVIRADRGPNLPVGYLGREVARTDASGAGLALLRVAANEQVEIVLDTSQATPSGGGRLVPENPSMKFTSTDREDMKLFDVRFDLAANRRPVASSARTLPVRLH